MPRAFALLSAICAARPLASMEFHHSYATQTLNRCARCAMFIEIKSLRSESWQTSPSKRSATALTTSPAALSFWTNSAKEYAESALDPLYLCRCGASTNKPLCDSIHEEIGFKAEETAK